MLEKPLKTVTDYVTKISESAGLALTAKQSLLVSMLLSSVLLQGTFSVTGVAALFLMRLSPAAIYAMLRRSKIPFDRLFWGAIKLLFELFDIKDIVITIDDTERERSKQCRVLPFVRKAICKATGGWVQAQNIVFFVLVTDRVTIPIWFHFHRPAKLSKDEKEICRKNPKRTKEFDGSYRTKVDLACIGLFIVARMLRKLGAELGVPLKVRAITADNGFASAQVQHAVVKHFGCQFVSKANPNQKVIYRRKETTLDKFFSRFSTVKKAMIIRGKKIHIEYKAARIFVKSYGRKVCVVALRYQDDKSWQYIFGTDLTWTAESNIKTYGLRWLVEVFFEDWKQYDGWGVGALQRSAEGAARGVFLSLLADLFLLYHQRTNPKLQEHGRHELYSAGTVVRYLQAESIHQAIEDVLDHENPREKLFEIQKELLRVAEKRVSLKHSNKWDFEGLAPTPSLSAKLERVNREEERKQRVMLQGQTAG